MKKNLQNIVLSLFFSSSLVFSQTDPQIVSIINKVSIDTLYENLKALSGEKQIMLSNTPTSISSRAYNNYGNLLAEEYLQLRLKQYGLNTSLQTFDGGGGNIIAVQRGITKPDQQVIICAHFDSRPYSGPAPGADDNGSGTSAVLESARILSQYKTDCTIIYALWDNEETGLNGSTYYAQLAKSKADNIIAVINMDMIGWDGNNDFLAEIHSRSVNKSNQIAMNLIKINADYGVGLNLVIVDPGSTSSDHSPFWNSNYSAVLLIENYTSRNGIRDFHPMYHTSLDNISYINKPYYEKCAKVSIGTLAYYAGIQTPSDVHQSVPLSYNLYQNYPNPFNPETKIKYSLDRDSQVKLTVYDALGRNVATLVDQFQIASHYEVNFKTGTTLASGIYFYVLSTGDHFSVRKMILSK